MIRTGLIAALLAGTAWLSLAAAMPTAALAQEVPTEWNFDPITGEPIPGRWPRLDADTQREVATDDGSTLIRLTKPSATWSFMADDRAAKVAATALAVLSTTDNTARSILLPIAVQENMTREGYWDAIAEKLRERQSDGGTVTVLRKTSTKLGDRAVIEGTVELKQPKIHVKYHVVVMQLGDVPFSVVSWCYADKYETLEADFRAIATAVQAKALPRTAIPIQDDSKAEVKVPDSAREWAAEAAPKLDSPEAVLAAALAALNKNDATSFAALHSGAQEPAFAQPRTSQRFSAIALRYDFAGYTLERKFVRDGEVLLRITLTMSDRKGGEKAELIMRTRSVRLVKENGAWKIDEAF
jgi:hypothetical protein